MDAVRQGDAVRIIRSIARDPEKLIQFRVPHAVKRLREHQLNAADIRFALRGCAVVASEFHGEELRHTCSGRTREGEVVEVPVAICGEPPSDRWLEVVTVIVRSQGGWVT